MPGPASARALREAAAGLGFAHVGIIPAAPAPHLAAYFRWLENGYHGEMGYMARPDRTLRCRDLNAILPGVRSLIIVAVDYHALTVPAAVLTDPSRGRIAAYAWGADYHDLIAARLGQLAAWLGGGGYRVYVDTGAILERSHAYRAGLGFIGKNTMLIHPRRGSYFFLGEILTDMDVDGYDDPGRETLCGRCQRCLVACPTAAFPAPYVLDARRCISYLTIEYKGAIPPELRPLMGNWIMGCDVCQAVCPFTRFTAPTREAAFLPVDLDRAAPPLLGLLEMDEAAFRARFAGSAVLRLKRERLVRNACVAAGNWGDPAARPALTRLLDDPSVLIREHAAWALDRLS